VRTVIWQGSGLGGHRSMVLLSHAGEREGLVWLLHSWALMNVGIFALTVPEARKAFTALRRP
jgi:hypothetical protein